MWYGNHELPDGRLARLDRIVQRRASASEAESVQLNASVGSEIIATAAPGEIIKLKDGYVVPRDTFGVEFFGRPAWLLRYKSWDSAKGLGTKVGAFVEGGASFVASLGIPVKVAVAIMAVLVASFAATTLDTATRLQRYVIQELASTVKFQPLTSKYGATLLAVIVAAIVAAVPPPGQTWATGMGKGGLILWPIFGATNQLLAGLALLVVAFYLARRKMATWFVAIPCAAMFVVPFSAMMYQVFSPDGWLHGGQYHLVVTGLAVLALQMWMLAEAVKLWPKVKGVLEAELPPVPRGFPVVEVAGETPPPSHATGLNK